MLRILFLAAILTVSLQASEKPYDFDEWTTDEIAAEIIRRIDASEPIAAWVQPAADRGMAMAHALAKCLDKPARMESLSNIIALAATCRQSNREVVRLYDPIAFQTFYSDQAAKEQARFAGLLEITPFTRRTVDALINAAPLPLLEWLKKQAAAENPDIEKLKLIWTQWGTVLHWKRERQHSTEIHALTAKFFSNPKLVEDPAIFAALVRFAGESRATGSTAAVLKALEHKNPQVRLEACRAVEHLKAPTPPAEYLAVPKFDDDVAVLTAWGDALQNWPNDPDAGVAALEAYNLHENIEIRRAILYSAGRATWKQRTELLGKPLRRTADPSAQGVALQSLAEKPEPELADKILKLMNGYPEQLPTQLVDALGTLKDPNAVEPLIKTLRASDNAAMQMKVVLALEKIGGSRAETELAAQLEKTSNLFFAQQIARALGRMKAAKGDQVLSALAEDTTAPLQVRMECIRGLGNFQSPEAKASLKKMDADLVRYFGFGATGSDSPSSRLEQIDLCRLLIKLALFQQGEKAAEQSAVDLYHEGSPTTQVAMLMMFAQLKLDHPVIAEGLRSPEFAIMLAAVNAAAAANPAKYRERLLELRNSPHIRAILEGSINPVTLEESLRKAIEAGEK